MLMINKSISQVSNKRARWHVNFFTKFLGENENTASVPKRKSKV